MVTLYEKVMQGKKTTYREYVSSTPVGVNEMTEPEMITLSVAAGVTCLLMLEKLLPPHKRVVANIRKVEEALLALAKGNGDPLDAEILQHWERCWNLTMATMQRSEA